MDAKFACDIQGVKNRIGKVRVRREIRSFATLSPCHVICSSLCIFLTSYCEAYKHTQVTAKPINTYKLLRSL